MTTEVATAGRFDEMKQTAVALVESGLFGVSTWQQALALGMISEAEGLPFVQAVTDYHVIKGKPVLKSERMLARFQKAGGRMKMMEHTDERVVAEFSHAQGGTVVIDWTIERARKAGLAGKDNYKQWPRQMLRARVISEGVRTVFPGATSGMYTPEETLDMSDTPAERDVTPAKPLTGVAAIAAKVAEKAAPPVSIPVAESASAIDPASGEMFDAGETHWLSNTDVAAEIQAAIKAKDTDMLISAVALLPRVENEGQRAELDVMARAGWKAIKAKAA